MSRRREARQQEKEDFLDANPQLVRYTTHIEVGRAEEDHMGSNIDARTLVKEPVLPPFVGQVTIDGEPVPTFNAILDADEEQSLVEFVGFPTGELSAEGRFAPDGPEGEWGSDPIVKEEMILPYMPGFDVLSLTENGFGVAQSEGGIMSYSLLDETIPMEPSGNDAALDGDETIYLEVRSPFLRDRGDDEDHIGMMLPEEENEDPAPPFELGGKELGIDFTVLGGSGTVQVTLIDLDGGDPVVVEMMAGGRRRGASEGHIDAEMVGDHAFDLVEISVTGDLEISVTGIDLSTNFDALEITR